MRAKEPIVPLGLCRNRTYASSMVSTFFASFAFFGAIIFLPRWFQFVHAFSPTNSGLAALPLMAGLIFSSIVSGLLVSRTGKYKWLLVGAILVMGVGSALMTQLTADTPLPIVWLWMFIAGLGVGPTFSVFTIVVQNAVPFNAARRCDLEPDLLPPDRWHRSRSRSSARSSDRPSSSRSHRR